MPLDQILRTIIGMEPYAVRERFEQFVYKHPHLTAKQTRFLSLLQNHIDKYGAIELGRLYEDPVTLVDASGIDGVFAEELAEELIRIIDSFHPHSTNHEETTYASD
jgi:type I restriction enzyme R subunit